MRAFLVLNGLFRSTINSLIHPKPINYYQHRLFLSLNRLYSNSTKTKMNEEIVYFRNTLNGQLDISFRYQNELYKIDREFNLKRDVNESLNSCLERLKNNMEKEINNKKKKRKLKEAKVIAAGPEVINNVDSPIIVELLQSGVEINKTMLLKEIIANCNENTEDLELQISTDVFKVRYNQPWVENIALPKCIIAGYYIYPQLLDIKFGNKADAKYEWYIAKQNSPKQKVTEIDNWKYLSDRLYCLLPSDCIDHYVKFVCSPRCNGINGVIAECLSNNVVQAGPVLCPFEIRQLNTTQSLNSKQFRILSYNILADLYAHTEFSQRELFNYCPSQFLDIEYRKKLFTKEIIGYNCDIICLQEVDLKIFKEFEILFKSFSYDGEEKMKFKTNEGSAIFFNTKRFQLIESNGCTLGENMATICETISEKVKKNESLFNRISIRSTVVQYLIVRSIDNPDKYLLIANTHLYFHPDSDHIRLIQMGLAMKYIEKVQQKFLLSNQQGIELSLVFCGDFNSVPECGICKLMLENYVPADFIDFQSNLKESINDLELQQPFKMESAYKELKYTNFTAGFAACIDHIFYQKDNLRLIKSVPPPTDEELAANIAIPSVVFPSDHVALVADLEWL